MSVSAVVLAAGKGVRMKSRTPKVLHDVCGRPMLAHVIAAVREAGAADVLVVASRDLADAVQSLHARAIVQEPQGGTGHAMQLAMQELGNGASDVLVVSGDMPLIPPSLLRDVEAKRGATSAPVVIVTARVPLPTNFGRVVREKGRVARIVESSDAGATERVIDEVNAGVYCFDAAALRKHLAALRPNNAQAELYLTDCIGAIAAAGEAVETVECLDPQDVVGVNTRVELARAQSIMRRRIMERHMLAGVTIIDPDTTYIDADVSIGEDTVVHPQTHLRGATTLGRDCTIGPGAMLENATIGDGSRVLYSVARDCTIGASVTLGPFAHVRSGSVIADAAHVGNFVELKKTRLGRGAKAGHLTYLGDAEIGEQANIGAGTITCNFDGKKKNKTKIGKRAFIGSNSSLVAPVEIGDDALTGAGSVVTHDVPPGERVAGNPARPLPKKQTDQT